MQTIVKYCGVPENDLYISISPEDLETMIYACTLAGKFSKSKQANDCERVAKMLIHVKALNAAQYEKE